MGGLQNIIDLEWTKKKKASRFKHNANSPYATNDQGRHAVESNPPSKPMHLFEAIGYIKQLVINWIDYKMYNSQHI